jgi:hypothetical protein
MNERILELARQVWPDPNISHVNHMKFAELIVRECIQVVDDMADPEEDSDRYVWALHNASEKIKQHFGVQE